MIHVNLQPRQKHEVKQSHLAEDGERTVAVEDVEPERACDNASHYHADDVGYLQLVEYHRGEQDDCEDNQEYRHRVCDKWGRCENHGRL